MYPAELFNTLCGSIFIFTISFKHFIVLYRAQFCAFCLHCSVGRGGGNGVLKILRINYEQSNSTANLPPFGSFCLTRLYF